MVSKLRNFPADTQSLPNSRHQTSQSWRSCWIVERLKDYCTATSLHGCGYITKDDLPNPERIFWSTIVLIAAITSVVMVWVSYNWNRETPTVTVIESTHFLTLNVPFPAITFCSINRVSKRKAYAVAEQLIKPSNISVEELVDLLPLAMDFSGISRSSDSDYLKLGRILHANSLTGLTLLQLLVPSCSDMLVECWWKGNVAQCDGIFQDVNTTEGICCSFNYLGHRNHTYAGKFTYSIPKKPHRVSSCGYQSGLTVTLDPQIDDYFGPHLSSYGFRVLIHDSYDYPDANAETKVLPLNTQNFISVLPQSIYATKEVAKLKPVTRNCLFDNERQLQVMQRYSYINCLAECRAMLTYELCGCMPLRYLNNGSYPSCKMEKIFCILENINVFTGAVPGLNKTIMRDFDSESRPCGCLPDCELNLYPTEIASARLVMSKAIVNSRKTAILKNRVIAHVYFSDLVSTRYRKDIFQDWIKILATFGGLLGLIMGFSIMTGFEFVYFLTIRPIFDRYRNKENGQKSIDSNKMYDS